MNSLLTTFIAWALLAGSATSFTTPSARSHAAGPMVMNAEPSAAVQINRRDMLRWTVATGFAVGGLGGMSSSSDAIGPIKLELTEPTYQEVDCPPNTPLQGSKATAGLKPVCVEVSVNADNPTQKPIKNAAVFGFVLDSSSVSVVANNPDGASDAGQFAQIKTIPPGKNQVKFTFIAAIPKSQPTIGDLTFPSLKAISYPGGEKFGPIDECEYDLNAPGCDGED
mmetsp:Transcript_15419/g.22678  ORF Transcript_15419/g.22678 Transcript_15419/m.22678 type:complete len:224 (-) Transcript_15419:175-846(-)